MSLLSDLLVDSVSGEELEGLLCGSGCELWKGCQSGRIKMWGEGRRKILVVGEAPGREEDEQGRPFVGRSGRFLRGVLSKLGIDLDRDCWVVNVVRCRPVDGEGKDRKPSDKEIMACSKVFDRDLEEVLGKGCKLIILLGGVACKRVLGTEDVGLMRGRVIPDLDRGCWIGVSYHPAGVLRQVNWDKYVDKLFYKDLERMIECMNDKVIDIREKMKYEVVKDVDGLNRLIDKVKERGYCGVDIETVGLRPYGEGKSVLCIGVGVGNKVWVIDCDSFDREVLRDSLKRVMEDRGVVKVFHNAGMELEWFRVWYGVDVVNFDDTMLMSYVLDEREGSHDLKFLVWVMFGVKGYDEKVKKCMKDLRKAKREDMWEYNAWDVFYTVKLWKLFRERVYKGKNEWVYKNLLLKSRDVFSKSEIEGCLIDEEYLNKLDEEFSGKIDKLMLDMKNIAGSFGMGDVNFNSSKQLGELLYKKMGLERIKVTKSGGDSTDAEALKELVDRGEDRYGLVEKLLEYKKYVKLKSTYIDGMRGLIVDGRVHPRYGLHTTVTGRTSCTEPNVQNIPKRKGKEVRGMFVAPEGYVIVASDYSQWEVRVVQMYARDNELGRAIWEGIDFHGYYTEVLTGIKQGEEGFKEARQVVKGAFTFASMYGAGVETITRYLWKGYLSKRFKKYEDAREFVREVQREFFEQFHGLKEWQNRLHRDYERKGYIETLFGRKRRAPIEHTQIINTPVQSVASDFTLLSMVRVYEELGLVPLFMIHDDLTYVVKEDELESVAKEIGRCMTEWGFEFVNVPIEVEQKVGKRWSEIKDYAVVGGGGG